MATESHMKAELGRGEPIFVVGKLVAQKTTRMSLGIKPVSPWVGLRSCGEARERTFPRLLPGLRFTCLFINRKVIRPKDHWKNFSVFFHSSLFFDSRVFKDEYAAGPVLVLSVTHAGKYM